MRGEDAQWHADHHTYHRGEGDLRQGFHGFLPVTQVEDQQERQGHESGQRPLALDEMRQGGEQGDEYEWVEESQGAGDAMDHELQALRDGVEVIRAVLGQPLDERRDVLAQGYFLIDKHDSELPPA
ncbi:hypothetical protein D3C75_737390 [compost metagenome]